MSKFHNFRPVENKTIAFAASATSANVEFTTTAAGSNGAALPTAIEIYNATTVAVAVKWGTDNTVAAANTDYIVGPGVDKVIDIGTAAWVAVKPISSVTGSVYLTRGLGS